MALKDLIEKAKASVIDDWKDAWKWASVRTPALGIALMGAAEVLGSSWNGLPQDLRENIPHAQTVAMILFGVSLFGRLIKQQKGPNDDGTNG